MRSDLQQLMRGIKRIRNVTILTHNIDYLFFNALPLGTLREMGEPSILIIADSERALESYRKQGRLQTELGTRYRVLPARAGRGFCFHPKAILLSGEEEDYLFVGSGNLSYGGWRSNGEVWVRYDRSKDGARPFAAFRSYLGALSPLIANRQALEHWLPSLGLEAGTAEPLFFRPGGPALLDQIVDSLRSFKVAHLIAAAPYFDERGKAVVSLAARFPDAQHEVWVPMSGSTLTPTAASAMSRVAKIRTYGYASANGADERFVHAKFIAAIHDKGVRVFLGSANLSEAALLLDGGRGNAELVAAVDLTEAEFANFCAPLLISDEPPTFHVLVEEKNETEFSKDLVITRASWAAGILEVAFESTEVLQELVLVADGVPQEISSVAGTLQIRCMSSPAEVRVKGRNHTSEISSEPHWVDNEEELSQSGAHRQLLDTAAKNAGHGATTVDIWTRLIGHLIQDIDETRQRQPGRDLAGERTDSPPFNLGDAFKTHYQAEVLRDGPLFSNCKRIDLATLLLRLFGVKSDSDSRLPELMLAEEDDEVPDGPQPDRELAKPSQARVASSAQRRRVPKLIESLVGRINSRSYVDVRHPHQIGRDLAILALLIRHAYRQGWVDEQFFFDQTAIVWSTYFLQHSPEAKVGLLDLVLNRGGSRVDNEEALASPELVGALLSWVSAVDHSRNDPETLRFRFSVWLGIGRYARLWTRHPLEPALRFASDALTAENPDCENPREMLIELWQESLSFGAGMIALEDILASVTPDPTRGALDNIEYSSGTIAWQSSRFGFCVTLQPCIRSRPTDVAVLSLSRATPQTTIRAAYLSPLRAHFEGKLDHLDLKMPRERRTSFLRVLGL